MLKSLYIHRQLSCISFGGDGMQDDSIRIKTNSALGKKLENKALKIRTGLPKRFRGTGNIGVAFISIPGVNSEMQAFSRFDTEVPDLTTGFILLQEEENFKFETLFINDINEVDPIKGYDRKCDTEAKILEQIAHELGNVSDIKGEIDLYTDRNPCLSCLGVIKQFKQMYPEIEIRVYYKSIHGIRF